MLPGVQQVNAQTVSRPVVDDTTNAIAFPGEAGKMLVAQKNARPIAAVEVRECSTVVTKR